MQAKAKQQASLENGEFQGDPRIADGAKMHSCYNYCPLFIKMAAEDQRN